MKKTIFVILIVFGSLNVNYCQTNWFSQTSGINFGLNSVFFVNDNTGYAVGAYNSTRYTLKTTNGGANWFTQTVPNPANLYSVYFINENTGYTAGQIGLIFKTTNGGSTWSQSYINTSEEYYSLSFINSNTGFAAGYTQFGNLRMTSNAGLNWVELSLYVPTYYISSIYFVNSTTGYFSSYFPAGIQKTTNSGLNWSQILVWNNYYDFKAVRFADPNAGYVIGNHNQPNGSNIFLKTTNGGNSWDSSGTGTSVKLNSLFFTAANIGYISCDSGMILSTSNSGTNWIIENFPANVNIKSICFPSQSTGYAVGTDGAIYKTTNAGGILVGVNPNGSSIPDKFILNQNYPNPFNPVTKIQFTVPLNKGGERGLFVQLTIYDLLGREVAALVNGELKPGSYEVGWDASNYPSGVYFYVLNADRFVEARKMVLLK